MSVPCTISEAVEILEGRRKQRKTPDTHCTPVDILGVVLNHSILQSPPASSSASFPKAEIWISDFSISDMSARVTLYGSTEIVRVAEQQIKVGDVLRFNRVSLNKNNSASDSFQFVLHDDPEPGFDWFRLGHIDSRNGTWDHQDETTRRIPDNMITSNLRIVEVVEWFRKNRTGHFQNDGGITPLPCKRRSLSEIQASVGLLSNITVRVTHYDFQISLQSPAGARKRRRGSTTPQSTIGFATVTDGSGVIMSLVDPGNRFASTIRTAKETGRLVMLTNISSKSQNDIQGRLSALDEVVLVPTKATATFLLPTTESSYTNNGNGGSLTPLEATATQTPDSKKKQTTLLSRILGLSIGGVSLKSTIRTFESPAQFLGTVLTPDGDYRSATLYLDSWNNISMGRDDNGIIAGPNVVKTLCGGVEAAELIRDESLGRHALNLVRALLNESILLRWTINENDNYDQADVARVVLSNL